MFLDKVISGGQTGADQGGLMAAKMHGIETGGWMPLGFKTLKGNAEWMKEIYGVQETQDTGYKTRTWRNVEDSDGTVRFASYFGSPGEICTLNGIKFHKKPHFDVLIYLDNLYISQPYIERFILWLKENNIKTLNVAGNSHKTSQHIGTFTVHFLSHTFQQLGHYLRWH